MIKNAARFAQHESALILPDDFVTRMGTLGVVGGGLLALVSLIF